jgi:hypothetical protein
MNGDCVAVSAAIWAELNDCQSWVVRASSVVELSAAIWEVLSAVMFVAMESSLSAGRRGHRSACGEL